MDDSAAEPVDPALDVDVIVLFSAGFGSLAAATDVLAAPTDLPDEGDADTGEAPPPPPALGADGADDEAEGIEDGAEGGAPPPSLGLIPSCFLALSRIAFFCCLVASRPGSN